MASGSRWVAFQVSAARHVNLQLDQIEPGGAFGHRMLDLQARVHFHEKETPLFRLVQEFHRAGIAVARGLAQAHRRFAKSLILFWSKNRAGGFLKNLLVAALDSAVAHPASPGGSVVVGDDLHLNVACSTLNKLLHENGRVAKGLECLGASALESFGEVAGLTNFANSVTPTPSGGLNKEWVAQVLSVAFGVGERLHRAVAPGGYLYLLSFGQAFRRDLVAHAPHYIAFRANEYDAHFMAKVRERGVLGHEAPSYPDRIGARGRQRALQTGIIHITALELPGVLIEHLSGAETYRLIRFADKHGMPVRFREERDCAQGCAVFLAELAGSVDEPHSSLATIDDSHPLEFEVHRLPDQWITGRYCYVDHTATSSNDIAACSTFNGPASTAPGTTTVR